jgi:hypothetical protein
MKFENWPLTEKTKKPSLSGDVVKEYETALTCQEYVRCNSMSRSISTLSGIAKKAQEGKGKIHPEFNIREDVGRIYTAGFNYLNLPLDYRPIVEVPEDQRLYSFTADRLERFILAYLSEDKYLLNYLKTDEIGITENKDVHEDVTHIFDYAEQFPHASKWLETVREKGEAEGYATTGYGTQRIFRTDDDRGKCAVAHVVQGTAAEAIRLLLPDVGGLSRNMEGCIVLVLFDAFLVSLPATLKAPDVELLRETIGDCSEKFGYSLVFNVEALGRNWA